MSDREAALEIIKELRNNPVRIRARANGGLQVLRVRPEIDSSRIAAIGYCFGGTMALELARGGSDILGAIDSASDRYCLSAWGVLLLWRNAEDPCVRRRCCWAFGGDDAGPAGPFSHCF